ncbi:UNVERIFIED_CONTAM: hypothetical protein RMT77_012919 [Armadillidium vulgare]
MLRLKLTFACMMEMSKFPLDSQVCTMEIASFSKTTRELTLSWKNLSPIKMYKHLKMPQFKIEEIVHTTCGESIQIGNYSCLVAEFHLKRSIGFHLVQSYLPTTLIVAISWVSFWMDVDSVPARTTLGVTTLLAVSTKSGIQDGLPQVSYVKAIDVWMGACTAFVFTSLIEFTLVNCLWRKGCNKTTKNPSPSSCTICPKTKLSGAEYQTVKRSSVVISGPQGTGVTVTTSNAAHQNGGVSNKECNCSCFKSETEVPQTPNILPQVPLRRMNIQKREWSVENYMKLAQNIDEACRVLFPLFFGCFNVCYWCYYLLL